MLSSDVFLKFLGFPFFFFAQMYTSIDAVHCHIYITPDRLLVIFQIKIA